MLKLKRYLFIIIITLLTTHGISGEKRSGDGQEFIVTTEWLSKHLHDKNIVLIEIGSREDYDKRHLPCAVFMETKDISTPRGEGLTLQVPSMEKLIASFEKAGVSDNSRIILYYGNDWITPTTRFFLTLDYMGFGDKTSILDGGLPQWLKENREVTAKPTIEKRGNIKTARAHPDIIAGVDYVAQNVDNPALQIIDARTENYYSGADTNYTRPGHIKGATSIPFPSLTTDNEPYLFKSKEELKKIFDNANPNNSKNIICYCHIGQQATLVYFIGSYLGYNMKLYDGSYQEWDKKADLPVMGAVKRK